MTETASQIQENPLLEGLRLRRTPEPCVLAIFCASGDLTERKLMPALYSLAVRRLLPEQFAILGVARSEETSEWFRERMKEAMKSFSRDPFGDASFTDCRVLQTWIGGACVFDAGVL